MEPNKLVVAELQLLATVKHAAEIMHGGLQLSKCGIAETWAECVTTEQVGAGHVQHMLWYNVGKDTFAVAVIEPNGNGGQHGTV